VKRLENLVYRSFLLINSCKNKKEKKDWAYLVYCFNKIPNL